MYTITRKQAFNFWCYFTLSSHIEMGCCLALPKIFVNVEGLLDDEKAKRNAEILAKIINNNHPSGEGEVNKAFWIMSMVRAYANYLNDSHNNDKFLNPDIFSFSAQELRKELNKQWIDIY